MTARTYWLDLFTPETWEEFLATGGDVSGFRAGRWKTVQRIQLDDYQLCYLTRVSRWVGVLRVVSEPFWDDTPIWQSDAFPARVRVEIVSTLTPETGIPVHDLADRLSMFQNMSSPKAWTGSFRGSPTKWSTSDGEAVVTAIRAAEQQPVHRPLPQRHSRRATAAAGKPTGQRREPPDAIGDRRLSFTDAAERILQTEANRQPMHYREVTQRALDRGLITTQGKTPEATMNAQIATEIERFNRRGERPRFVRHGRGYFGLARWQHQGLISEVEAHNRKVRHALLERIQAMDPVEFEALVGELLTAIGFENVEVTNPGSDGGIDVRGTLVIGEVIRTKMAVQVKRWKRNVQAPTVQQVRGSLGAHEQGLIITTSDYSSGAKAEAERPDATPVALMNGRQFVNLLIEQDIAVQRTPLDILELSEGGVEAP